MTNTPLFRLTINLIAAAFCIVALILNIIEGNIPFIILMAMLIPINLYLAYINSETLAKEKKDKENASR